MGQTSSATMQAIDNILNDAMPAKGGKTNNPEPTTGGDDKNLEFRLKKHIQERDEYKGQNEQLRQLVAKMSGQLEILSKQGQAQEEDPTEGMTETEAALYKGVKSLEEQLQTVTQALGQVQEVAVKTDYRNREQSFFENNPNISKDAAKEMILGYVKSNPEIADKIVSGKVPLERVYKMAILEGDSQVFDTATQDGSKIFGTGKPESSQAAAEPSEADNWNKARRVLHNPESENKKEAVDVGVGEIAKDILAIMDSQNL